MFTSSDWFSSRLFPARGASGSKGKRGKKRGKPRIKKHASFLQPLENRLCLTISTVSILATDGTAAEVFSGGTQNGGNFQISRDVADTAINVIVSVSGTATNGSDYSTINSSYSMAIGVSSINIALTVTDDSNSETLVETATITINSDPSYLIQSGHGTASANITDNDPSLNTIVDQLAQEPDSGTSTLTFTAVLAYATDHSISIPVATADNTALAGSTLDYLAASTTLVIGAGATSASQTITINADAAQENDETFYWNATLPSGMTGDTQGVATIRDSSTFGADTRGEENPTIPQSAALVVPTGNPFSASSLDPPAGIDRGDVKFIRRP